MRANGTEKIVLHLSSEWGENLEKTAFERLNFTWALAPTTAIDTKDLIAFATKASHFSCAYLDIVREKIEKRQYENNFIGIKNNLK